MEHIGDRIRARRKVLGLSQRDLADRMSYTSHSTIARIECGAIDPPLSKVREFSEVLGVSIRYLIGADDYAEELTEVYSGVDTYINMMSDKNTSKIYRDFLDLQLSRSELLELYKYAQYIVSRR